MLLQFAVENYKSIRERVVWSMLAVEGVEHRQGQTVHIEGVGEVLRVAGLYGPNASGKSNLAGAWYYLCDLVAEGRRPGKYTGRIPFKLDAAWRSRPTSLELVLHVDGKTWTYGISVDDVVVLEEWLVCQEDTVFERRTSSSKQTAVDWGNGLLADEQRRQFFSFVAMGTRPEQPLLAELRDRGAEEFRALHDFFLMGSLPFRPDHSFAGLSIDLVADLVCRDHVTRDLLGKLLSALETGVRGLQFAVEDEEVLRAIEQGEDVDSGLLEQLREAGEGVKLSFLHRGEGGESVALEAHELSDGTRRLLGLVPGWNLLLRHPLSLSLSLFVDELDRSFHPSLTRQLLELLFVREEQRSQLLFTTHDTNLLDAGLLGADGIWFVEKDESGATRLYSLAEFDPEHLQALTGHLEEGYLQGRFGAIPFLGDPAKLGWTGEEE